LWKTKGLSEDSPAGKKGKASRELKKEGVSGVLAHEDLPEYAEFSLPLEEHVHDLTPPADRDYDDKVEDSPGYSQNIERDLVKPGESEDIGGKKVHYRRDGYLSERRRRERKK